MRIINERLIIRTLFIIQQNFIRTKYHFGGFSLIFFPSFYLGLISVEYFWEEASSSSYCCCENERAAGVCGDDVVRGISLVYFPAELSRAAGNTEEDRTLDRNISSYEVLLDYKKCPYQSLID